MMKQGGLVLLLAAFQLATISALSPPKEQDGSQDDPWDFTLLEESTEEPTSEGTQIASHSATGYDTFSDGWLYCEDHYQSRHVMLDIKITDISGKPTPSCSKNQYNNIRLNIQRYLNLGSMNFPEWPGYLHFDLPILDEAAAGDESQENDLSRTCSPRLDKMPCKKDRCMSGCTVVNTTYCGEHPERPSFVGWNNLGRDVAYALRELNYECLGNPKKLQILVQVDPIPVGEDAPASTFGPSQDPSMHTTSSEPSPELTLSPTPFWWIFSPLHDWPFDCPGPASPRTPSPDPEDDELEPSSDPSSYLSMTFTPTIPKNISSPSNSNEDHAMELSSDPSSLFMTSSPEISTETLPPSNSNEDYAMELSSDPSSLFMTSPPEVPFKTLSPSNSNEDHAMELSSDPSSLSMTTSPTPEVFNALPHEEDTKNWHIILARNGYYDQPSPETLNTRVKSHMSFYFPPGMGQFPDGYRVSRLHSETRDFVVTFLKGFQWGLDVETFYPVYMEDFMVQVNPNVPDRIDLSFEIIVIVANDGISPDLVSSESVGDALVSANWSEFLVHSINQKHIFVHHPTKVIFRVVENV